MNVKKFLLVMFATATFIGLTPCASAYMMITYKTGEMIWDSEKSTEQGESYDFDSYFFETEATQFEISFITPDFDLVVGNQQYLTFNDPVVAVNQTTDGSNFPHPLTIDKGSFISFELSPDNSLQLFSFSVNFTYPFNPFDGIARHGSLIGSGSVDPANRESSNYDGFTFQQDDWSYKRHEMVWVFDTTAHFYTESYNPMIIDKISVPEPYTLFLLFTGLAFITAKRKMNQSN